MNKQEIKNKLKINYKQLKPCSYEDFVYELKIWSDTWYHKIKLSIEKNLSLFPGDTGDMGELFGSMITGKIGTASGGSGFDLSNGDEADEAKMCCWVQPTICKCGTKNIKSRSIFFKNNKCENCDSEFEYVNDSRWGIDSKAGVEYKEQLDNYILQIIEPYEYRYDNMKFIYSCYIITAKDDNFHKYLVNQNENSRSNNCNLLPYSFDFYRGHPKLKIKLYITLPSTDSKIEKVFFDLDNEEVEKMPLTIPSVSELRILAETCGVSIKGNKKELIKNLEVKFNGNPADYLSIRSKSLNKPRGDTSRKI